MFVVSTPSLWHSVTTAWAKTPPFLRTPSLMGSVLGSLVHTRLLQVTTTTSFYFSTWLLLFSLPTTSPVPPTCIFACQILFICYILVRVLYYEEQKVSLGDVGKMGWDCPRAPDTGTAATAAARAMDVSLYLLFYITCRCTWWSTDYVPACQGFEEGDI